MLLNVPANLASVDGGNTANYYYNADGRRVQKNANGSVTNYIYNLEGEQIAEFDVSGNWIRGEMFVGHNHVATYYLGATYFNHSDWLGTERARTLAAGGSPCETTASLPFGDGQVEIGSCSAASNRHFTGKERDSESVLDNFGARYDASSMGRFMTPDSLPWIDWQRGDEEDQKKFDDFVSNPQNFNMYSYVNNDPLNKTDPTGMQGCKAGDRTFTTCTITIVYDPKTSKGTITVTGQNKGDKDPTVLLTGSVVVGGDGHVTPTGTFTAKSWEKDHVSTKYGSWASTKWSDSSWGKNVFGPFQLHIQELDKQGIYIHGTLGPSWSPTTWGNTVVGSTSHGCIRLCNQDDIALHNLMPNPQGNQIIIRTTPKSATDEDQ